MNPSTNRNAPTAKQLRYLRLLAEQTETTFLPPASRGDASREINRLRQLKDTTPKPPPANEEVGQEQLVYATAVQPGEVSGFGAAASWRTRPSPVMSAAPEQSRVGALTELARYEVSSGERVVYGQRINGCVRITDRPGSGTGRSYLIERELQQDGYSALKALVADYTEQARELDEVPMASSIIRHQLEQLTTDA